MSSYTGEHVRLELPCLRAGDNATFRAAAGDEAVLVLLAGDVEWNGVPAQRADVFDGRAAAVYLPPGAAVEVQARASTELALATTVGMRVPAARRDGAVTVQPDHVVVRERGKRGWQREVHDVVAGNVDAHCLLVGETFNNAGEWSSFPPHKHDGTDGETALEEVYYYRFDKPDGFGFQGLYESNGDERAVFVRHGMIVGIPRGYHPVCAAPGYRLYYLWALVGTPRQLTMHEDPAHRWLHDA